MQWYDPPDTTETRPVYTLNIFEFVLVRVI